MGTSSREAQEEIRNMIGIHLPGSLYSHYVPTTFLRFPAWGPHLSPLKSYTKRHIGLSMWRHRRLDAELGTSMHGNSRGPEDYKNTKISHSGSKAQYKGDTRNR